MDLIAVKTQKKGVRHMVFQKSEMFIKPWFILRCIVITFVGQCGR